jgi:inhibitor of KinA
MVNQNINLYTIYPLGDSAVTIDFGNIINEQLNNKVLGIQQWINDNRFEGLKDSIAAYSSLTLWYNPFVVKKQYAVKSSVFEWVKGQLEEAYANAVSIEEDNVDNDIIEIPVCYDDVFGKDITDVLKEKKITKEELIYLHTTPVYRVYMIGFLPGFPYMAEVDEKLVMPRKMQPVLVAKGSVGITGKQTGIYTFDSPGGWQIIGRTPLSLFDASKELRPSLLKAGDRVQFKSIDKKEFDNNNW